MFIYLTSQTSHMITRINGVGGAAGKWLLFEPFLSLLKFILPQSSEPSDSCKHSSGSDREGEGGGKAKKWLFQAKNAWNSQIAISNDGEQEIGCLFVDVLSQDLDNSISRQSWCSHDRSGVNWEERVRSGAEPGHFLIMKDCLVSENIKRVHSNQSNKPTTLFSRFYSLDYATKTLIVKSKLLVLIKYNSI